MASASQHKEEPNTTDEIIDCPECNGEGFTEEYDCNVGSASLCCGGCFKNVVCTECNGEKTIENPDFEEIED
jgi:hypothetical protein